MDRVKLTARQLAILVDAAGNPVGEAVNYYGGGFESVTWKRNAAKLRDLGLLRDYPHGSGFAITDAGRDALRWPFASLDIASAAVARWRRDNPELGGHVIGWAYVRCRGGGVGVRIGLDSRGRELAGDKRNPVLPDGLDRELIRGR